jgi:hypothetical protein
MRLKAWTYVGLASLILFGSCEKQPANHRPVIESILLNPEVNFTPGSDIQVSVQVRDKDQDELDYFWEAEGGTILEPEQNSTTWVLDTGAEPLSYESISVTVSDGKSLVSESRTIQVSEGLIMAGRVTFAGTSIPVTGVEISIGKFTTQSDENGYYSIAHLKEGTASVRATKAGFDSFEEVVYVDNPKSVYHIPMTSPTHTGRVSGNVKTIDGLMYEDLKVVLLNPDETESELVAYTDRFGAFTMDNVPMGRRNLLIRNEATESHFYEDSMIFQINLDNSGSSYDARIKIKRTILSDIHVSEKELWIVDEVDSDGFYLIGLGQRMELKEFISVPADAEGAMFYLDSYVIGGCDLVGKLPSHRVWISNIENEYLGGISFGGEGSNFPAQVAWYPSEPPTFIGVYGKKIKFHLEVFEENSCLPSPFWRVYQLAFSYYY